MKGSLINSICSREWLGKGTGMVRQRSRMHTGCIRVKSRITPHLSLIAMLMMLVVCLFGVNEKAWGWAGARVYVYSNPAAGGFVYVNTSNSGPSSYTKTSDDASQSHKTAITNKNWDFYLFAEPADGYDFVGWATSSGSSSYESTTQKGYKVNKVGYPSVFYTEYNYYARFAPHTYTMIFHGNGESSGEMANQVYKYNEEKKLTANAYQRKYTLSFDANGGECDVDELTATSAFQGWATTQNGGVVYSNQQKLKNLTKEDGIVYNLYAVWNIASVTLPTPTREGYLFDGWYNGDTFVKKGGVSYTPEANMTLTAHWVEKLTPQFVLNKTQVELDDKAVLTLTNVNNPSINISPAGKVAYNAQNGELTALSLGTVTITVTQQAVGDIKYKQEQLSLEVIRKTPSLTVSIDGVERTSKAVEQGKNAAITFNKVSDANVVVTNVSGGNFAAYANGVITASEIGTAVFRATLPQTNTYQSTYVDFSIKVTEDMSHLPITINKSEVYDAVTTNCPISGTCGWNNSNGIYVGKTDGGVSAATNWDDKYVTIHFNGVPDKLSFNYKYAYHDELTKNTAVPPFSSTDPNQRYFLYVEESANGSDWTALSWQDTDPQANERSSGDQQLKKTTRYLRFHLHANYAAYYKDIHVTELKYVQDPDPANIDLGTAVINSGKVSKTTLVNWCNVAPLAVTSSNPRFTVSPASFGGYEDYGSQILTISYTHGSAVGPQEADITLSNKNANFDKTIHVTAETTKRPQTITWNSALVSTGYAMNVGEQYPDANIAAVATVVRGARVTYTSANSNFIEVVADTALLAKGVGKVKIAAHQAGDDEYAAVSDTVEFQVTNLLKQSITWDQDLMSLLTTSGTVELNATASSNGQITYTSGNSDVVSVSGNTLTVVGEGETTITATQAGGEIGGQTYLPISLTVSVYVRNPASQCNGKALNVNSLTLGSSNLSQEYKLSGIPETLTFSALHGKKSGQWGTAPSYASLIVEQYACINDLWDWYEVYNHVVGTSATASGNVSIDASATKIRFRTGETAVDHTISGILVSIKKFMSADVKSVDLNVEANSIWQQTITVSHSNIDKMSVTTKQGLLTLSSSTLGDGCGDFGNDAFEVSYTPTNKNTEYKDTIVITDGKTVPSTIEIPVRLYAQALNQSINGFELPTSAKTTDIISLTATATSGLAVTYSPSDPNKAQIINNNQLIFLAAGEVTVTASQAGGGAYNAAEAIEKTIVANKVTPAIVENPAVAPIQYKETFNNSQLSAGKATVTLRGAAGTKVDGTFTWETLHETNVDVQQGTYDYSVTFTPADGGMYNPKTFTMRVAISRADGAITMNNGSVKVKVAGINDNLDECKIDLDGLVKSKIEDGNRAGGISFAFKSSGTKSVENAEIDANNVFTATAVGTYTIVATQAETDYYEAASVEFTVTVNRLMPTIVFDNTDNPEYIYSYDTIIRPAYRVYNEHVLDRNVQYASNNVAIHVGAYGLDTLFARNVTAEEGTAVHVTITASTTQDDWYEAAEVTVDHHYDVRAKRSPVFTMDGQSNVAVSKTLNIGETATITYNEYTDEHFSIGKAAGLDYISYEHNAGTRTITVTALKGALASDGVQTLTLTQPGNDYLFPREIVYTFTVKKNVSTMSLDGLTSSMYVEDTVTSIYSGLANTGDAVNFSCSPEGSMKMENGKLIALQAGENTVTFSQTATEYWTGVSVSKTITVSRYNAAISSELKTRHPWFFMMEHPFQSTNTENPLTITSSDESLAKYVTAEDKIYVYGTSGNVTFTVNQEGNYKYNAVVNYQKTFEIFKPENHVPFTLTSGNWDNYTGSTKGTVQWSDGGVLCGVASGLAAGFNYDAKNIVLSFTGIPETLRFDFINANLIATQYGWHFYQSSDNENWIVLKEYADQLMNSTGGTSEGSEVFKLNPDTRYVKLEYHGNFGGLFKNISISERKEIAPRRDTLDMGLGYNGNAATIRKSIVDWYNINTCRVYINGANADRFELAEGDDEISSHLDEYGTKELSISYKHDVNTDTEHKAILHIVEQKPNGSDGLAAEVVLIGRTSRAPQTIIWREDLTPMPSEGAFENAAYATSGNEVVLTSLNPEYMTVGGDNGLTLSPVAPGTAYIRAYQAGDDKWAEVADTIAIEVTTLKVQYINWTDKLSNLKREDGKTTTVTLNATSTAGLSITYELDEAARAFASISGNVLSLTGWGSGQVIAKQAGNEEYVAVQKSKTIVSRDPDAGCKPLVGEYTEEYTIWTLGEKEIELEGEPGTIEFDAKCNASALWGLWVGEYYDGYYHEVQEISRLGDNNLTSSYKHFGPFALHRNSTKVKIYTNTGATMNRTFKNVEVTLAKYLEVAENSMDFTSVDYGASKDQVFYINYSNITGALDVELENKDNTQFTIQTSMVGEDCGEIGVEVPIRIRCSGTTIGTEENAVIISNKNQSLRVPISATVTQVSQTITWEPTLDVLTTDNVQLSATATSGNEVSFTSGNTNIAEVVYEGGVYSLNIKTYGDVVITAHQGGNTYWGAAEDVAKTFHISRTIPNILTDPTATGVVLPNTLAGSTLEGGSVEGDIAGTFRWQDATTNVTKGVVTYTAVFDPENDDIYAEVEFEVAVPILKTPQTIVWDRADETEEWCTAEILMNASAALPITYHSSDSTRAYVVNGALHVLKYGTVTITAEQKGNETYAEAESVSKTIVLKRTQLDLVLPEVSNMFVHHFLSNAQFLTGGATDKVNGEAVGGTYSWVKPDSVMDVPNENPNCEALFTPFDANIYEPKACMLTVNVLRYQPAVTQNFTTDPVPFGAKLSELALHGTGSAIDDKDPGTPEVTGTFAWKNENHVPLISESSAIYVFHPDNTTWYEDVEIIVPISITSEGYVFTYNGDGDWTEMSKWQDSNVPDGDGNDDIIINGNVTITSDVTVQNMTVNGSLTVGNALVEPTVIVLDNLHVTKEAEMALTNGEVQVNNFTLDAKLGDETHSAASGQVTGEEQLNITGKAYFVMSFDPAGAISHGWYDFTVPFEVDLNNGIERINSGADKVMKCGQDFLIMEDDEVSFVNGGKGWRQFSSGVLQPGKLYTITFDDDINQNTFRFAWNGHGNLSNGNTYDAEFLSSSDDSRSGWNALGNAMLRHGYIAGSYKTQAYNHTDNTYDLMSGDKTFAVGTAFFIQVEAAGAIDWTAAPATNERPLYAPKRAANDVEEFRLSLRNEETNAVNDVFFISASEDATDAYVIGHDLMKKGTPTAAKKAQMWTTKGGNKLCDIEATLIDNKAITALSLFTPKAGQYALTIDEAPENATLFLTKNGRAIWNLSMNPYVFDLTQGTTEGYGLRIVAEEQAMTDIENAEIEGEGVRKVLIDDKIYIVTPDGKMYDIIGKGVKF